MSAETDRAVAALVDMCPRHTVEGRAIQDLDCGDCGSRQDATQIYLLGLIEDAKKGLGL